ncbi:MAG: RNA polymerase sigma factor [Verrucomicrobiota bacterium]
MNQSQQKQTLLRWLESHRGIIYKVVRAYAYQAQDQEDLFQEIATQLWKAAPRFRGEAKESTFVYQVSLYAALSWTRKERRRKEDPAEFNDSDQVLFQTCEDQPDPRLDWLYECIHKLDESDRSLTLLLLDGLSHREIAEIMGISANNVGVKLLRIKRRLTNLLERENNHEL